MIDVPRVTPREIKPRVETGEALLVCAYDDELKFLRMRLEGAISWFEFNKNLNRIAKDREIVLYCA